MEHIPVGNGSVQQCYVIKTTPGLHYILEVCGSTSVRVTAPVSPTSPLKLSGAGITFDAETEKILQAPQTTFNIESPGTTMASGAEVDMTLVNGTSTSVSHPVGVKVMKSRDVKVTLYEVTHEVVG